MKNCIFILLLILTSIVHAEKEYRFISYNTAKGLSQNSVTCIYQSRDGTIWVGTQDGLNSFDGKNFKSYRFLSEDSTTLSDHYILSIKEDKFGFLWVGTSHGLNRIQIRSGTIKRFYLSHEERNRIQAPYPDIQVLNSGDLFVPHSSNPSIISKNSIPVNIHDRTVSSIVLNDIWTVENNQLKKIEVRTGKIIEKITVPNGINSASVKCESSKHQMLWIYTNYPQPKILFYNTSTKQWMNEVINIPEEINHIHFHRNGESWVSTGNGIYIVENFRIKQHLISQSNLTSSFPLGSILSSYEDNQGNVWVGSASAGLSFYHPSFDQYRLISSGIENNMVTSAITVQNQYWLGTRGGLIIQEKNQKPRVLFSGKKIFYVLKDRKNQMWVAVRDDGIYILDLAGKVIKSYHQEDEKLCSKKVLSLFLDSKGQVHVCAEKGQFVFHSLDRWTPYYQLKRSPVSTGWYTLSASEDKNGNIYYNKHLGIDIRNSKGELIQTILSAEEKSPISKAIVTSSVQDKQGDIWIGTLRNGVYRMHHNRLKQYSTSNGLSSNLIYGLVCDNAGRIWATSPSGLNIYVPKDNRFYKLSITDGLPNYDFELGSMSIADNGKILIGSTSGLTVINPEYIKLNIVSVHALIAQVQIYGKSIDQIHSSCQLLPGYKSISFEFSVKEKMLSSKVLYQYRLLGLDENWIDLKDDNTQITYSQLPYRKLKMQVRAAYSNQDFNSSPIEEFSFEVRPPFYETIWFKTLMLLFSLGLLIVIIHYYNQYRLRKQYRELEVQKELQSERLRISRDLHDNIGAYTSALISGIQHIKNNKKDREEKIDELKDYAANIMGYLRETIWVLNKDEVTLDAFKDRFMDYGHRILRNYPNVKLSLNSELKKEDILQPKVSLNLFRILQEALHNACKHSRGSEVTISVNNENKLVWKIIDNGIGLSEQVRDDSYGLTNMRQRALEIGYTLEIVSQKNQGTTVTLTEK